MRKAGVPWDPGPADQPLRMRSASSSTARDAQRLLTIRQRRKSPRNSSNLISHLINTPTRTPPARVRNIYTSAQGTSCATPNSRAKTSGPGCYRPALCEYRQLTRYGAPKGQPRASSASCSKLMPWTSGSACLCTCHHSDPSRRKTQVTRSDQSCSGSPPTRPR
jgi:hypothetical protein